MEQKQPNGSLGISKVDDVNKTLQLLDDVIVDEVLIDNARDVKPAGSAKEDTVDGHDYTDIDELIKMKRPPPEKGAKGNHSKGLNTEDANVDGKADTGKPEDLKETSKENQDINNTEKAFLQKSKDIVTNNDEESSSNKPKTQPQIDNHKKGGSIWDQNPATDNGDKRHSGNEYISTQEVMSEFMTNTRIYQKHGFSLRRVKKHVESYDMLLLKE